MKILIIIIAIVPLVASSRDSDIIGSCGQKVSNEFDLAISRPMTFSDTNNTFASDPGSALAFCRDSKNGINAAKSIIKSCVSGIQRQVAALLLSGISRGLRKECKDQESMKSHYENLKCFNSIIKDLRGAMRAFTSDLRRVNRMNGEQKVYGLCCSYFNFDKNVRKSSQGICSDSNNRHLMSIMEDYSGDVLDMLCSNVQKDRRACDSVKWPESTKSDLEKHSFTFANAFLVTVGNLGER